MDQQPKHTPGPYEAGTLPATNDAAIYSAATGEMVATVHSGASHLDAPSDETALHNIALFTAAPRLRESLEEVLNEDAAQTRTPSRDAARALLARIAIGAGPEFTNERAVELRHYDALLDEQIREMGPQSEIETIAAEFDEEEDIGHSFG